MAIPHSILVIGATGKQGGAVVNALLASPTASSIKIFAPTRNPESASAQALATKSSNIKIIKGDLDDAPAIFQAAGEPIDAVFLVTVPNMKKDAKEAEIRQGSDMVDAAIANGVKHFVYTSVDRHGEHSDSNPTNVAHFISKHEVEVHLKSKAHGSGMKWTILRPAAFLDNFEPGFFGKLMMTWVTQMGDTPLQVVSVKDIGIVAAKALLNPDEFHTRAISLAGDEVTAKQANDVYQKLYGKPFPTTYHFIADLVKWMLTDVGTMLTWFKEVQYGADLEENKKLNPNIQNLETWLKETSKHKV